MPADDNTKTLFLARIEEILNLLDHESFIEARERYDQLASEIEPFQPLIDDRDADYDVLFALTEIATRGHDPHWNYPEEIRELLDELRAMP